MIQCTRCVAGITSSWYPQIQQIDWKAKPRQTSGSMQTNGPKQDSQNLSFDTNYRFVVYGV